MARRQPRVGGHDAALFERPWARALDDHVGGGEEAAQDLPAVLLGEVQGDALLAAVDHVEEPPQAAPAAVRPRGRLDLHHPGPRQAQEVPAQRPRPQRRQVDHRHVRQRPGRRDGCRDRGRANRQRRQRLRGVGHGDRLLRQQRHGQAQQPRTFGRLPGPPVTECGGDRRPGRFGVASVDAEPGGEELTVLGPWERDRQPAVGGAEQASGTAAARPAVSGQAGDGGALSQQGDGVEFDGLAERCRPLPDDGGPPVQPGHAVDRAGPAAGRRIGR